MGKYDGLTAYLESLDANYLNLSFRQIERIIGAKLPASARKYQAWWANDPSHVEAKAWLSAGWKTESVNVGGEELSFRHPKYHEAG